MALLRSRRRPTRSLPSVPAREIHRPGNRRRLSSRRVNRPHQRLTHWATWLSTDRSRIQNDDRYGLDHLHQAFDGTGSRSDPLSSLFSTATPTTASVILRDRCPARERKQVDLFASSPPVDERVGADRCAAIGLELTRFRGHGLLCDRVLLELDGAPSPGLTPESGVHRTGSTPRRLTWTPPNERQICRSRAVAFCAVGAIGPSCRRAVRRGLPPLTDRCYRAPDAACSMSATTAAGCET
jgi:hypothetical protein